MLLNDIHNAINENEEWAWESEAPITYYQVEYDIRIKTLKVFFIEEYHFDGDNWGEIEIKTHETKIYEDTISEVDYINLLTSVINDPRDKLKNVCFLRVGDFDEQLD